MPRPVVPIGEAPRARSRSASRCLCQGKMTCADSEMTSWPFERMTPRARRASISATSTAGSRTTPLPMTQVFPHGRMPLG